MKEGKEGGFYAKLGNKPNQDRGKDALSVLSAHLTKDESGQEAFDFNTIERMPEALNIEKVQGRSTAFSFTSRRSTLSLTQSAKRRTSRPRKEIHQLA